MPRKNSQRRHGTKRVSQLWYRPDDYELVKAAAKLDRRPMTTFAIRATLQAARDVIDQQFIRLCNRPTNHEGR